MTEKLVLSLLENMAKALRGAKGRCRRGDGVMDIGQLWVIGMDTVRVTHLALGYFGKLGDWATLIIRQFSCLNENWK